MALTKLDQMYRAVILDEAQHPRHHGVLPAFDHEITVRNPSCGDVLHLQIKEDAGRVTGRGLLWQWLYDFSSKC
ncbi:NifU-like protein [Lacticaseibacillus paracasei subsp. paracasei Lpp41]|uniref:NifU-like protein n=1 Tax=Lacticaseibacillus paracasei subsp. paracasei Lpp41 TaxID=1256208 RepID=A0A829H4G6_LACPA|nr:NifU-like protein [Lacticaseibacillus paracasei subsp. paracasei Lpp41]